jgi:hypothetical protein
VAAFLIALAVTAGATAGDPPAGGGSWTIVDSYAIPEGASGLAWDGTWLYCGIYGVNGGEVYRIDPATGASTLLFTGPQEDAFGLTFDGTYLWTTDHPGSSATPAVAMQLDWDGTLLDQFELPDHYASGIAYDDGAFWASRYYPDPGHVYRLDEVGTILDEFGAPDDQPWDLCIENGNLWIADYWGDTLYKLDASTGALLESHPSEGTDPAGIVWDGAYLWYCDNGEGGNDFLYKVDLAGGGTPQIEISASSHDFGVVPIGTVAAWDLMVTNAGDGALEISGVDFTPADDLSCLASFPVSIAPGETDVLPIEFAPTSFGGLDATAAVLSNDPVHPSESVALSGWGVAPDPAIALSEQSHDYGAVRVHAHTRWFVEVTNQGAQTLTIDEIAIDDARFYLDQSIALPINLDPLATAQIGLWFSPAAAQSYAATVSISSNARGPVDVSLSGSGDASEQPMGAVLWSYTIDTSFDNSPKAMAPGPDVNGDGVADVIVCSEDDFVRCFNGNAHGTGDVLWEHEIPGGSVYSQKGIQIIDDISEDGLADVVVGSAWGGRLIRAISGGTGLAVWTHDTDEYGDGGWVYQVDVSHDYNGDGDDDVLAATGDDSSDTGPKRVYCLNGLSGVPIWETPLNGPVFAVIGVQDFTGDGQPDAVAGASNDDETQGFAVGIDGADGSIEWTFPVGGTSVWSVAQLGDITADGVADVIVGDFAGGAVYGLDAVSGTQVYAAGGFGLLTRFETLDDVNGDGHPEILPAHSSDFARAISGQDGGALWTSPVADNASSVARIADVTGDGINDAVVGTLFSSNVTYFLDGVDGTVLHSANYGTPVDAITAIPDVVGDDSWEMVAGGRNGLVSCISGGTAVGFDPADVNQDGQVDVQDLVEVIVAWGPNPGHPADVNGDGVVDVQDLVMVLLAWD